MGFYDRIKSVRGELTQNEFADKLGVHLTTVQLWETGNIPKGDILLHIHQISSQLATTPMNKNFMFNFFQTPPTFITACQSMFMKK